ncbi:MAG: membrane protein insertion efficiency factor YidD [Elusimicrobia bacterium]|nr:membrane protein insertion efficiency factor YidD [Elusimicrobiota bacterium]
MSISGALRPVLLEVLDVFRVVRSALLPPCCRFVPTCSEYAREAIGNLPLHAAAGRILRRLLRCHPFHPGGYDPLKLS